MSDQMHTRRWFLGTVAVFLAAVAGGARPGALRAATRRARDRHPTPRPGVDASKVLPRARLADQPELAEVFDHVRQMPQVVDGIRCQCGCAEVPGYYSLLSCFEGDAMAQHCEVCQAQARLVHRLHREKQTLDQIRAAIDAEFG